LTPQASSAPHASSAPEPADPHDTRRASPMRSCLFFSVALALHPLASAAEPVEFSSTTIDIGMVVSDIEKSLAFYRDGVGFRELDSFEVSDTLAGAAGLTDDKPLAVRVLVLGEGPGSTKLKLMQVADTQQRTGDNAFIHSHTGFRYLTIQVADTDAAIARLATLGVKPLAECPVALPERLAKGIFLTCVKDPDGNLVELLGPRK